MMRRIIWQATLRPDLGQGSTGRVVMAADMLSKENFALKIDPSGQHAAALAREVAFGKLCRHRNVVATYALLKHNDSHHMGILMELAGVSLACALKRGRPDNGDAVSIMAQVCHGLAYVHACKVVHCDVKPGNIMVSGLREGFNHWCLHFGARIMLADFSAALFVDDAMKTGSIGSLTVTEPYRAPELVVHPRHHVKFGTEIDVWALGLTAFDCAAFNPQGELMFQTLLGSGPRRYTFKLVPERQFYVVRQARLQQHPEVTDCLRVFVAQCTNTADRRPSVALAAVTLHRQL